MKSTIEITSYARELMGKTDEELHDFEEALARFLFSINAKYCLVSKAGNSLNLFIPIGKEHP